jgi:hypothetical protein
VLEEVLVADYPGDALDAIALFAENGLAPPGGLGIRRDLE